MKIASKTDIGKVRSTNQDSFAAGELNDGTAWAVVCDGMGGANGGNIASANAVTIVSEYISSSYHEGMDSNSLRTLLQSALYGANVRLYDMANKIESLSGMGTTVVVTIVSNGVAHIAHAGDSRAYIIHDGELSQITRDHSVVQTMVDKGQITEEEAKKLVYELKINYEKENRGLRINYLGNTFKLTTRPEHKEYYQRLLDSSTGYALSAAALEVLAIIAYNEPITRITIDEMRGV